MVSIDNFNALTPDVVIQCAERVLGVRCTGLCRQLNSYINRVFELRTDDGNGIVIKFYRPGRWRTTALLDEHEFLHELQEHELPVVAPLPDSHGRTLQETSGLHYALFPKKLGRACDEPTPDEWGQLGRLIARIHLVGEIHQPRNRIVITPEQSTRDNLEFILRQDLIPREYRGQYEAVCKELINIAEPMFAGVEMIRVHGDCHTGNLVYRPGESFYLIDFDDMAVGPPIQDIWMLLPGYGNESLYEIELLLDGYETFRRFDRRTLQLIEPLRAMRFVHFTAWCIVQIGDGAASRLAPGWGTPSYWRSEIGDLRRQLEKIHETTHNYYQ